MFKPEFYSIVGDASTKDARILNTFSELPESKYLSIEKDPNQFNFWQETRLTDSLNEFTIEREPAKVIVNSLSSRRFYKEFEFITKGIVDLRKIYLVMSFDANPLFKLRLKSIPKLFTLFTLENVSISLGNNELQLFQSGSISYYDICNYLYFFNYDNVEKEIINSLGGFFDYERTKVTNSDLPIIQEFFGDYLGNKQEKMIVPLWIFFPFFKQKRTFLPNDLKIKLKINSRYDEYVTCFFEDLFYESNKLKIDLSMLLNKEWSMNKFMYNYLDIYKEVYNFDNSGFLSLQFNINSFKPLHIKFTLIENTKINLSSFYINSIDFYIEHILIDGSNTSLEYYYNQEVNSKYNYENYFESINFTDSQINSELYTPLTPEFLIRKRANEYFITLDPNRICNKNMMSLDNQAQNIRLRIKYKRLLTDEERKFVIFYSLPSQLRISPEKNCEIVRWPTISAPSSQSYILNTFNNN